MEILVIGATGMIGSRVVAETVQRGHKLTAASRSGAFVQGASQAVALELADTAAVCAAIEASDVTVISVPPDQCTATDALDRALLSSSIIRMCSDLRMMELCQNQ